MKIKIITNTFQKYHRQDVAVQSWTHLTRLFPNIEIVNLQFSDETDIKFYPELSTLYVLDDSSKTLISDATKKLPCLNEMFSQGLSQDCEYFIITNSDVIIMPNLIEYIQNNKPSAMACSRLDVEDINSYQDVLDKNLKPVRWEPAGFDVFVFKKEWADKHRNYFTTPYFLGKPKFDVVWAGYMKIFGDNSPLGNQYPPYCFHIHHGNSACYLECAEKDWNHGLLKKYPLDALMHNIMVLHLKMNLLKRTPWGAFLSIPEQEKNFEKEFFEILNAYNTD